MSDLGNVDSEIPDVALVKLTGAFAVDRALLRDERVEFIVRGTVTGVAFKSDKGVLVRAHSVKLETGGEPVDKLLSEATDFLQAIEDQREGRAPLPFDEDEEPTDGG